MLRPLLLVGGTLVLSLMANDWIAGLALVVLWEGWKHLSRGAGPPVIAAAFTHQWIQVCIAVFYAALTGRRVMQMQSSDYRPMVLIGLATLVAMFTGFYLASGGGRRHGRDEVSGPSLPVDLPRIAMAYVASVLFVGGLLAFAWSHPAVTQIIYVLALARFVLLFILVRRLATPRFRWGWILFILLAEVAIGFTGFFADFRLPIAIITIALLGPASRRRAQTWAMLAFMAILAVGAGVVWTTVKPIIRIKTDYSNSQTERLQTVAQVAQMSLTSRADAWQYHADTTVSRLWAVYYPALALARVPSVLPHENGDLLWFAIRHIFMPRFLFPNKPELPSDSEEVRKYSGVWVSGREVRTSYAFGYAAESYVDFGLPLMFLPIFILGALMGAAHRFLMRSMHFGELRTATTVVIFWALMSSFELSWAMMLGLGLTQLFVGVAAGTLVDRLISARSRRAIVRTRRASDVNKSGGNTIVASLG